MGRSISSERVRIASPCPAAWNEMKGDDRVRFCELCNLNVYNLSAMAREQAEQLVNQHEGRLCVSYFQRQDGTIITRDCPLGLRMARAAAAKLVGLAASLCLFLVGLVSILGPGSRWVRAADLRGVEPFKSVRNRLVPAPQVFQTLGAVVAPAKKQRRPWLMNPALTSQIRGRVSIRHRVVGTP